MKSLITKSTEVLALQTLAIEVLPEVVTRRDELLATSATVTEITDGFSQDDAATIAKNLKTLIAEVEDSRTEVKAPVLVIGKKIDDAAKDFVAKLKSELLRIATAPDSLLNKFAAAQLKKAQEAERLRLNELARIENERLAAEQRARDAQVVLDAAAAKPATVATEAVQQAMATVQAVKVAVVANQAAATAVASAMMPAPITTTAAPSKMVWKFRVTDLAKVYAAKPNYCTLEISKDAVNTAIRNGVRECPGLEIYQEMETKIK